MINPQPVDDFRSPYGTIEPVVPRISPEEQRPVEPPKRRRNWRRIFGFSFLTVFVALGTYAFARYNALKNEIVVAHDGQNSAILSYDPTNKNSKLDASLFTQYGDGRFNVVLVGVGGEKHKGSYLTDSIQVMSLDTINKKISVTSVPRDLYVSIPKHGRSKINATYQVGESAKKGSGPQLVREVLGDVLGTRISNFVLIDFTGLEELVDALGGIEVDVPKAIYDPYYPDSKTEGYEPFSIAAGTQTMDGHTALRYSRSRKTTSDFDRSMRQQLVMAAIKKKATSAGVISNPAKVNSMLTAISKHIRTDMQPDQIKAFLNIYKDITSENSTAHVLDTSSQLGLLTSTTDPVAGYIAYPPAGYEKWGEIHSWFASNNLDPLLVREAPTVTVLNGGKATDKQLQEVVKQLNAYGYAAKLGTVSTGKSKSTTTQVYYTKTGESKSFSRNYLGTTFGSKAISGSPAGSASDFEIVYIPSATTAAAKATSTKSPTPTKSPTSTP